MENNVYVLEQLARERLEAARTFMARAAQVAAARPRRPTASWRRLLRAVCQRFSRGAGRTQRRDTSVEATRS